MSDKRRNDYDSPWKEALDHYFPEFLALLYPRIHAEIDWSKGHEFLDKELQQVVRDAVSGLRYADKLVKVATRDGAETWVLVHGWKLRLIRLLYERDYNREAVLELFRVIDWLLQLPEELEREFLQELITIEEQKEMPYVTSAERFGLELGYQKGRQERQQEARQEGEATIVLRQIALKFGDPSEAVRERIRNADAETLLRWSERLLTAQTLDEVWSD